MAKKFKHSGTLGDLIFSLSIMKHFGGGEFYLHLNQVNWIAKYYYNSEPAAYHKNKMNETDFEFLKDFLEEQSYITKVSILDSSKTEITHNLDKFRSLFVGHPANYITTYCMAFGINDPETIKKLNTDPWLSVKNPKKIDGKPIIVNRSSRWAPKEKNPQWDKWLDKKYDEKSIFLGLPNEYEEFKKFSNWNIDYYPITNMLEMAEVIAGSELFIGNQSVALSIAQGLGVNYFFERRRDLSLERNENYYPNHTHGNCF